MSSHFIDIFRKIQDNLLPHIEDKLDKIDLEIIYKTPLGFDFEQETLDAFEITGEAEDMIKQWINPGENIKFEQIYKATRDGFDSGKFHDICDGKGPMISLIKAETGRVFGGYTFKPWKSAGAWQDDDKAFIYSVTDKTKHTQFQKHNEAVYFERTFHLWYGYDILLYNNCDANSSSYSILGSTYKGPEGCEYGNEISKNYLAGKSAFKVTEIECFLVKFD